MVAAEQKNGFRLRKHLKRAANLLMLMREKVGPCKQKCPMRVKNNHFSVVAETACKNGAHVAAFKIKAILSLLHDARIQTG